MSDIRTVQIMDQLRAKHDLRIRGLADLTPEGVSAAVANGGRFLVCDYCISLVIVSLRGRSAVWFRPANAGRRMLGVRYSLVSLFLGWWGVPWGLIYTPWTIFTNLAGGRDVTAEVLPLLLEYHQTAPAEPRP